METSNNVAAVAPSQAEQPSSYTITCSTRSSLGTAMDSQRARIAAIAKMCGGSAEQSEAYPGWSPNLQSAVLQVC